MEPFRSLRAPACPLPLANVDTDQLIPARFMRRTRAEGYGDLLLHDLRDVSPSLALDAPEHRGASILVARRNFGCGSSREAAVYALVDAGFRCVVAPSFGDIFAANAVNNGLLPAVVTEAGVEVLLRHLEGAVLEVTVDLEHKTIAAADLDLPFVIDPVWRTKLLNGWDDLDLTLQHEDTIGRFEAADRMSRPWAQALGTK